MLFHMVNQCKIFRLFIMVIITNVIIVSYCYDYMLLLLLCYVVRHTVT